MTKYKLTATQLQKIANLCVQEQGSMDGVKAEASLMARPLRQGRLSTARTGMVCTIT